MAPPVLGCTAALRSEGGLRRAQKPKVPRAKLTGNGQYVVDMTLSADDAVILRAVRAPVEHTPRSALVRRVCRAGSNQARDAGVCPPPGFGTSGFFLQTLALGLQRHLCQPAPCLQKAACYHECSAGCIECNLHFTALTLTWMQGRFAVCGESLMTSCIPASNYLQV